MRCLRCGDCCQETDMLLTAHDIMRLEKQGHAKETFVRFDQEGYALMRNRQGHCVFFSPDQKSCTVYTFRPSGCRVYPVMVDEDVGIVVDSICRAKESISDSEKALRGKRVVRILERVDREAQRRIRK